jgi:hypothetical protein
LRSFILFTNGCDPKFKGVFEFVQMPKKEIKNCGASNSPVVTTAASTIAAVGDARRGIATAERARRTLSPKRA